MWVHIFICIVLFLFASGCRSVRSSTRRWWVSRCTTTMSCCSTHWTNPSPCSSAWSPLRSAPNRSVSSGTTPYCECNTGRADEETDEVVLFWHCPLVFVFHISAGNGGWSAKGCEVVFRNSTHISCQCYHMTSFAVLMDISRREVSNTKHFYHHQNYRVLAYFSKPTFSLLILKFVSEWRNPTDQNPDVEYSECHAGLPLPHHDFPSLSESDAVQQNKYNQQWSHCSLLLWAHLHPGHQPGRQHGNKSALFSTDLTSPVSL